MKAKRLPSTLISSLLLIVLTAGTAFAQSSASVYSGIEKGDFRPGYSSSSIWKMGAEAHTAGYFYGGKTYLTGAFSFEQMNGKDMFTSMFINPGYYPIDVLEFTPGDKTLQTYRFSGGIRHQVASAWRIGGDIAFTSQNFAKRKDIRHTNYGLDLSLAPKLIYTTPAGTSFGLSLLYRKTSESIEAEPVGAATADTYMAFFDKGLRYGTLQAWDGAGIHLSESGVGRLPVREFSYGLGVHFAQSAWGVSSDVSYQRTRGFVGEKDYDWYRFPGHKVEADASWRRNWDCGWHSVLRFHFAWRGQRLEESVIDKVSSGGITLPEVYAWNLVSRRRQTQFAPTLLLQPRYGTLRTIRLGYAAMIMDEQASPSYPYTDRWHAAMHRLQGAVVLRPGGCRIPSRFTLTLGGKVLWANDFEQGLEPAADAPGTDALTPESVPTRLTSDWVRKHEYMTASAAGLDGTLRYEFVSLKGLYLSLDGAWLHAYRVHYLNGKNRFTATLRLGYDF